MARPPTVSLPPDVVYDRTIGKPLNLREEIFVREYLTNGGKAAAAWRAAEPDKNPKNSAIQGSRWLNRPNIAAVVAEANRYADVRKRAVIERYVVEQERITECLASMAFTTLDQLCTWESVTDANGTVIDQRVRLKALADIDHRALYAIGSIKRSANGDLTVTLPDRRQVLMDIARVKGWISGGDAPTQMVQFNVER